MRKEKFISIIYLSLIGFLLSSSENGITIKKTSFNKDVYNNLSNKNISQKIKIADYEKKIKIGDTFLAKRKEKKESIFQLDPGKRRPKFIGGKFIGVENGKLIFEAPNRKIIKSKNSILIDEIDALYIGEVREFRDLHTKWSSYLAILMVPGSITMANTVGDTDIAPKEIGAIATWFMFTGIGSAIYAPIIASIDFNKRLKKSEEIIISADEWTIVY
tara:strand:+ start:372 stop:1022 length:651 start_codon:yes stop_codon:yes gene_type:complete